MLEEPIANGCWALLRSFLTRRRCCRLPLTNLGINYKWAPCGHHFGEDQQLRGQLTNHHEFHSHVEQQHADVEVGFLSLSPDGTCSLASPHKLLWGFWRTPFLEGLKEHQKEIQFHISYLDTPSQSLVTSHVICSACCKGMM